MNAKTTIRKFLFVSLWVLIGSGMLSLLIAAIGKKHRDHCRDYEISFRGAPNLFINAKDIAALLMKATEGTIKGQPIAAFKLHQLEQMLEENTWIKDAELYFTNRDVLKVIIAERQPIARVFTTGTGSFYIDSTGRRLPLTNQPPVRVPVFTGFPDKKQWSSKDSALIQDLRKVASFIANDTFWSAQIAQVDITEERNFEMIPVVGNHLIRIGNAESLEQKFHRLMLFYQQVLSKTGFDKYNAIDVEYQGQVVASKQKTVNRVDSVQLRANIEKLLRQAREAEMVSEDESPAITADTVSVKPVTATTAKKESDSPPVKKTIVKGKETERKKQLTVTIPKPTKPKESDKKPKAVMPAKKN